MISKTIEMLKTALEMEKKGKVFYEEKASTCKNLIGREIFKTLADDEVTHVERIKKIYAALDKGESFGDSWENVKGTHSDLMGFFRGLASKYQTETTANSSDIEALDVGIEFESKSVEFYSAALKHVSDKQEKVFLEKMIQEEKTHRVLLSDTKQYLEDPSSYFIEREHHSLDGA